jgi:RNA polymerase sigma-70 factor (ECF subfamily)
MSADDKYLGELAKRVKGGDAAAFTELVNLTIQIAFAHAFSFLRSHSDAEDAVQEAYTKAWRNIHTLKESESFRGWILTIVRNTCCDIAKTKSKKPHVIDDLGNYAAPPESDPLILEENRKMVRDCLSGLSQECQCLLNQAAVGTKHREAAEICGLKPTIASRIKFRCGKELKQCLETKLQ